MTATATAMPTRHEDLSRDDSQHDDDGVGSAREGDFLLELARIYPDLRRRAERLTGSATAADDLLHDALERGLKNQARFHTGGSPERWMKTILLRVFIDARRRARRHPHILCAQPDDFPAVTVAPGEVGQEWERFSDEDLRAAIAQLPPSFRSVYQAYAVDRRTHAEIASALGLPAGTVGTRIMRARSKLRRILCENAARPRAEAPALRVLSGGAQSAAARPAPTRARRARAVTEQTGAQQAVG